MGPKSGAAFLIIFPWWWQETEAAALAVWSVAQAVTSAHCPRGHWSISSFLVSWAHVSSRSWTVRRPVSQSAVSLGPPPPASGDWSPRQAPAWLLTSSLNLWVTHRSPSSCEESEMLQDLCCSHRLLPTESGIRKTVVTDGFDPWVRKITCKRKWQPTPVLFLGNSKDRGAWRAAVHGVAKLDMTEHAHGHRGV